VASPWFGLNVDIGSLRTGDPYEEVATLAPYASTWQVKELVYRKGVAEKTDVKAIVRIMRDAGYSGYAPLETLGPRVTRARRCASSSRSSRRRSLSRRSTARSLASAPGGGAMHEEPLHKEAVLGLLDETIRTLERDDVALRVSACEALGIGSSEWAACRDQVVAELQEAEEWAAREDAIEAHVDEAPPTDTDHGPEYLPSNQTLALFQSAMDEEIERGARRLHGRDPRWLTTVVHRLRTRFTGKVPFVEHAALTDFRAELPERCRVVLVSDWGTGNHHSAAVAQRIRATDPDHVVHLGDIYYSGTPREVQRNFFDVWRAHGPSRARYWALNANHDMYCGGSGTSSTCCQRSASPRATSPRQRALAIRGARHGVRRSQPHAAAGGVARCTARRPARSVLLTHHHLVSPFRKPGYRLGGWLRPFMTAGRIDAWFWGHDHYLIEFGDMHGVKCRCIGHGGVPHRVPPTRYRYDVDVRRIERRAAPGDPAHGISGFALLTFEGPALHIAYVDEAGGTSWEERW
jgi:hypothetical protein